MSDITPIGNQPINGFPIDETSVNPTDKPSSPAAGALTNHHLPPIKESSEFPMTVTNTLTDNEQGNPAIFPPGIQFDSATISILLNGLRNKTGESLLKISGDRLASLKASLHNKLTEKLKLLDEQFAKRNEELEKQKSKMLGGLLGKIFSAIAAFFMAVLTVVTLGAATPLAIATTTISVSLACYSIADAAITGVNYQRSLNGEPLLPTMDQLLGKVFSAVLQFYFGVTKENADKASGYIAMAFMMALTISTVVMTAGAAAPTAMATMMRALKVAQALTTIAQGSTAILEGVTTVQLGKIQEDFANITAEMQEKSAAQVTLQKRLDEIQKEIEELIKAINTFFEHSADVVKNTGDSVTRRIRNTA